MAFNRQTFRTRTLTAIIFAAVMLLGLLWNKWSFLILFSVIHFGCWWEYLKLAEKIHKTNFHIYTKLGLMVMGYGLMLWFCDASYYVNGYNLKENFSLPISAAGFTLLLIGIFQKNTIRLKAFAMAVLGLIYVSLCWGLMMDLYENELYIKTHDKIFVDEIAGIINIPLFIVVTIWINDTMAYIIGSLIGKTPLTKISPKKTWEGTIGGIILCVIVMGFIYPQIFFLISKTGTLVITGSIALTVAIFGTLGDLLESKLKRMASVKDSGTIMPGHGGFLDRFDSLLLATPFVWLYIQLFIR